MITYLQPGVKLHNWGDLFLLTPQITEVSPPPLPIELHGITTQVALKQQDTIDLNWVNIFLSSSDIFVVYKTTPSTVHTVPHSLNRIPITQVYTLDGRRIYPHITATNTSVIIESTTPITCIIILR
jgi:hypothetical protein